MPLTSFDPVSCPKVQIIIIVPGSWKQGLHVVVSLMHLNKRQSSQASVSLDTGNLDHSRSFFVLSPKFLSPIHYSHWSGLLLDCIHSIYI